jgi:hypothetical protein
MNVEHDDFRDEPKGCCSRQRCIGGTRGAVKKVDDKEPGLMLDSDSAAGIHHLMRNDEVMDAAFDETRDKPIVDSHSKMQLHKIREVTLGDQSWSFEEKIEAYPLRENWQIGVAMINF